MKTIEELGELFLGTRLKRLSDHLYDEVDKIYKRHEIALSSRITAIIFLLYQDGDAAITEIADALGITHPAVNQMSKKLSQQGYINARPDDKDERRRLLSLTPAGKELVEQLVPIWENLQYCLDDMLKASEHQLLPAVLDLEHQNQQLCLSERIVAREKMRTANEVEIFTWQPEFAEDFKRLNIEWLEKYFYVEEYDNEVLSNPEKYILAPGGNIYFARYRGEIIGTVALMVLPEGRVELTKMAVTEKYQGLKVGRKLMEFAIERFKASNGKLLFLESNKRLVPAVTLYEKMGFVHKPSPSNSHYQRADVYMEYEPNSDQL
ncbi:bifunctional helix-turn-helix transcriptional regulator/GNAT family N-acetyltransferase [Planctobacterium marinum]|uniref:MarR family transcriptional regulator n=1 Tax=Planctobacterium marinum TaxID=1631968 RepID=A0AA48KS79_9ALTE|nr:MarR family transcriptional regulator [Planctobacterium marinum]